MQGRLWQAWSKPHFRAQSRRFWWSDIWWGKKGHKRCKFHYLYRATFARLTRPYLLPSKFKEFAPTCDTAELNKCTPDEIANTYDNTILYEDYLQSELINALEAKKINLKLPCSFSQIMERAWVKMVYIYTACLTPSLQMSKNTSQPSSFQAIASF